MIPLFIPLAVSLIFAPLSTVESTFPLFSLITVPLLSAYKLDPFSFSLSTSPIPLLTSPKLRATPEFEATNPRFPVFSIIPFSLFIATLPSPDACIPKLSLFLIIPLFIEVAPSLVSIPFLNLFSIIPLFIPRLPTPLTLIPPRPLLWIRLLFIPKAPSSIFKPPFSSFLRIPSLIIWLFSPLANIAYFPLSLSESIFLFSIIPSLVFTAIPPLIAFIPLSPVLETFPLFTTKLPNPSATIPFGPIWLIFPLFIPKASSPFTYIPAFALPVIFPLFITCAPVNAPIPICFFPVVKSSEVSSISPSFIILALSYANPPNTWWLTSSSRSLEDLVDIFCVGSTSGVITIFFLFIAIVPSALALSPWFLSVVLSVSSIKICSCVFIISFPSCQI